MTNKEAIKFLQSRRDLIRTDYPDIEDYAEALDLAIEALERESVGNSDKLDCISRKHLLSEVENLKKSPWFNSDINGSKIIRKEAVEIVEDLCIKQEPSVQPDRVKTELNGVKTELEDCEDCISREDLLKKCVYAPIAPVIKGDSVHYEDVVFARDIINAEPIPQESKTGHWIETYGEIDSKYGRHSYKCSECNKYASYFIGGSEDWWDVNKPHYCPNCGARMSEVSE